MFTEKVTALLELSDQERYTMSYDYFELIENNYMNNNNVLLFFSNVHVWKTYNALFIIRTLVKYMIETGSEYQFLQNFEAIPTTVQGNNDVETVNKKNLGDVAVHIDGASAKEAAAKNSVINKFVDGSKFEAFVDAIVNMIVVIPVK